MEVPSPSKLPSGATTRYSVGMVWVPEEAPASIPVVKSPHKLKMSFVPNLNNHSIRSNTLNTDHI